MHVQVCGLVTMLVYVCISLFLTVCMRVRECVRLMNMHALNNACKHVNLYVYTRHCYACPTLCLTHHYTIRK